MNPDPASLENLQDIVTPSPVSWWPPALGWWMLLAAVVVVVGMIAFRVWRSWRVNAYRRAALRALQMATTVPEVAAILKRTALAAYPRTEIASLTGIAWSNWLGKTSGESVPDEIGQALGRGVFAEADNVDAAQVAGFAANWIRCHRGPTSDTEGRHGA